MERLVVLGGSSPFSVALVDALSLRESMAPAELALAGRNREHLALVARYARHRLEPHGWALSLHTELDSALENARWVVHQIRYGGLEGRAEDEALALQFGCTPDETLGPAALNTAIRILPELRETARRLAELCPDAWVLNLANPLSLTTSLMVEAGVRRCVGLCELPSVTARRAAEVLGRAFEDCQWEYAGLNHRGFLTGLSWNGVDGIAELSRQLGGSSFEGVAAKDIARLRAIPTKYFALLRRGSAVTAGRSAKVASIRRRVVEELRRRPEASPASLRLRYTEWYPESVVPMLAALRSKQATSHIVNERQPDGITRELHASVADGSIATRPRSSTRGEVSDWIARFERHESALLDFAREPLAEALEAALDLDPLVPSRRVTALAKALWERHPRRRRIASA